MTKSQNYKIREDQGMLNPVKKRQIFIALKNMPKRIAGSLKAALAPAMLVKSFAFFFKNKPLLGNHGKLFISIIFFLVIISSGYYLTKTFVFSRANLYSLVFSPIPALNFSPKINLIPSETLSVLPSFAPSILPSAPAIVLHSAAPTPISAFLPLSEPTPVSSSISAPGSTPLEAITPAPSPAPFPSPTPYKDFVNYKFGIATGNTLPGLSDSELNNFFDDMVALGMGWLRFDIDWENVQFSDNSKFDWHNIDRIVEAANARRIKLLPVLAYTPKWARSPECSDTPNCPPADLNDYAVFVKEAVSRYEPKGIYAWEIWNEPNLVLFWKPFPIAASYLAMLKLAHTTIKRQDPSAFIVLGGLGPGDIKKGDVDQLDFLKQLYRLGAQPYFEVLGFHPYSYPVAPSYFQQWSAWSQMNETSISIRSIMKENNDEAKMIWLTEYGAPTNGPGSLATLKNYNLFLHPDHVTEDLQAEILRDSFASLEKMSWAGPLFWYSYKDLGIDDSTNENFFGLMRYDGSKKPAYEMLRNILSGGK